jgi:ketosteroid isomerase-like protein
LHKDWDKVIEMNRRDITLASAVTLGSAILGIAASGAAVACETDDLLAVVEEYRKAMVEGNGARLLELSADDMSFGHANGVVQTKVEFVKTVVDKAEVFNSIKLYDHSMHVVGDLAIARHTFDADLVFQGKNLQLILNIVQTWKKEDGRWRLFVRQAYKPIVV